MHGAINAVCVGGMTRWLCRFDGFWEAAVKSGWRMDDTIVPTGETRLIL